MSSVSEQKLLAVAHEAARSAAAELIARFDTRHDGVRWKSTPTDPVSDADIAAEAAIRAVLARERPNDAILGEEGGATGDAGGARCAGSSIRSTERSTTCTGSRSSPSASRARTPTAVSSAVVLDPATDETFAATRSGPATSGEKPISGSGCSELARALVATGFGYDAEVRGQQGLVLARLLPRIAHVRRHGAAALDLCGCASGMFDAYYERGVKAWDIAAGSLICARAGLTVRPLAPQGILPAGVLVAPAAIADELESLVTAPPPPAPGAASPACGG